MKILYVLVIGLLPMSTVSVEDQDLLDSHNISTTVSTISTTPISPVAEIKIDGSSCRTPKDEVGSCTSLVECEPLIQELHLKLHHSSLKDFVNFLRQSNQACVLPPPTVCCPIDKNRLLPITRIPTRDDGCGVPNYPPDRIIGGKESEIGAWPWIALLGYENIFGEVKFRCGGILITQGHALTAAHCILSNLQFVRLGEHDITSTLDTLHIDIRIAKMERHPDFSRQDGHSDIGILYLQRNAPYTKAVKPICLPPKDQIYQQLFPYVAGWGKTLEDGNSSNVPQEILIPIHNNSVCRTLYGQLNRLYSEKQFHNAIICAGDLNGIVDTCYGDSGGPLMIPEYYGNDRFFVAIGIVSYSIGCGRPNRPGAYTSISHFTDWIEKKVAETSTVLTVKNDVS